jgi:hypothetical protein
MTPSSQPEPVNKQAALNQPSNELVDEGAHKALEQGPVSLPPLPAPKLDLFTECNLGLWHRGLSYNQDGAGFDLAALNDKAGDNPAFSRVLITCDDGNVYSLENGTSRIVNFHSVDGISQGAPVGGYFKRDEIRSLSDPARRCLVVGEEPRIPGSGCLPGKITEIVAVYSGIRTDRGQQLGHNDIIERIVNNQMKSTIDPETGAREVQAFSQFFIGELENRFAKGPENGIYGFGSICGRNAWINITVKKDELDLRALDQLMEAIRGFRVHFIEARKSDGREFNDPLTKITREVFANFPDAELCASYIGKNSIRCKDFWARKDMSDPENASSFKHHVEARGGMLDADEVVFELINPASPVVDEIKAAYPGFKLRFEKGAYAVAL